MPARVLSRTSQELLSLLVRSARHQLQQQQTTQNWALQMAFNIKFAKALLLSREFKVHKC